MQFKISHEAALNYFYAEVVGKADISPWRITYAEKRAALTSDRWAVTCANRAMRDHMEAQWMQTALFRDLMDNYPEGSMRHMAVWRRLNENRHGGHIMFKFEDKKLSMRCKLAWHDIEVTPEPA